MKKWFAFLLAVIVFFTVHEGLHALTAMIYGEYEAFHIRPLGLEVTAKTPVADRSGFRVDQHTTHTRLTGQGHLVT